MSADRGRAVLVAGASRFVWLTEAGEPLELDRDDVAERLAGAAPLVCHAAETFRRLRLERLPAYDVLELFAFVRPARFCLPTPAGLALALDLDRPHDAIDRAAVVRRAAALLLAEFAADADREAIELAGAMGAGGWRWGEALLAAVADRETRRLAAGPFAAWRRVGEWSEHAPPTPPGSRPVEPAEARRRLAEMLGEGAEARPEQADYASAVTAAFAPRETEGAPRFVLAEAGTGVGKTLGYLAPATLWSERNDAPVWVSTYTRNLQHQIDRELDRLFPDRERKARRVVIRKGRENYLCLLNLEEAVSTIGGRPHDAAALGLMARWTAATRDGDMVGGDFPAWLPDLVGRGRTRGLADRRGECVYSACPHYRRCFVERSVRRARTAEIVVANHALVMAQAAMGGIDDSYLPTRYVFDEGHHVFDAADSAFGAELSGGEASDLRRWLAGREVESGRTRSRGLKTRIGELLDGDGEGLAALDEVLRAARALPGDGWLARLAGGAPSGPAEEFLAAVRKQVRARAAGLDEGYGAEADCRPADPDAIAAASRLEAALARLSAPLAALTARLQRRLDVDAAALDSAQRLRIEAIARSLARRNAGMLAAWRAMLRALRAESDPAFVDWFAVERIDGREIDVGFQRRYLDPTRPFAEAVAAPAHGVVVTSATLTDGRLAADAADAEAAWATAEARSGARHLPERIRARVPSPFDYPALTRVLVVRDVRRDDPAQVAAAYRELFVAAGGGALGLFTAIGRLRAVHARIAPALEEAGLPLYAQHVDGLDTGTLIDIFRAETDSCLLGTDAVRDGVDVPGRSVRLIVFDRVPWPRPDILHRARKAAFGGTAYDDTIVRLRLKQAFGRLVRRADDKGVFVMLDSRLPSRLTTAFPEGVAIERIGLAEAIAAIRGFLAPTAAAAPSPP